MSDSESEIQLLDAKTIKKSNLKNYIQAILFFMCLFISSIFQFQYNSLQHIISRLYNLKEENIIFFTLFFILGMGICSAQILFSQKPKRFKIQSNISLGAVITLYLLMFFGIAEYIQLLLQQIALGYYAALYQQNMLEFAAQKFKYHRKRPLIITVLNIAPSLGSGLGMILPLVLTEDIELQARITKMHIMIVGLVLSLTLLLLSQFIQYQARETIENIGIKPFIKNKQFVSLIRIQACQFTLTVILGMNIEKILEYFDIHSKTKNLLFIAFGLGGIFSSIAYSIWLSDKDQEFLVKTYSRSIFILLILIGTCLYLRIIPLVLFLVFLFGAQIFPLMSLCNMVLSNWRHKFDLTKSLTVLFLFSQITSFLTITILQELLGAFLKEIYNISFQIALVSLSLMIFSMYVRFYH